MCSIGGWISEKPLPSSVAEALAGALIYHGESRGSQSAGVYVHGRGVHKRAMNPKDFVYTPEFSAMFTEPGLICLTHTRAPTCGGLGDEQAQPFVSADGKVITVHNGVFHDPPEIAKRFNILKPSGVDSELVTSYIAEYGINHLPNFLSSVNGSAAIGAVADDKLYLARDGGPLTIQRLTVPIAGKITIFASTPEMLGAAMRFCWLLSRGLNGQDLEHRAFFSVTAEGETKLGDVPYRAYTTPSASTTIKGFTRPDQQSLPVPSYGDGRRGGKRNKSDRDKREERSRKYWDEEMKAGGWKAGEHGIFSHPEFTGE